MKAICALSGISFHCDHFPATVSSQDLAHPLFYVRQEKLLSYVETLWQEGELTEIDSYLLFLAILESTGQIEWRVPVHRTEKTPSIVANNMERLSTICRKITGLPNKAKVLPFFSISKESNTLDNVSSWLESWEQALASYIRGYKSESELRRKLDLEGYLEKLIKDKNKSVASYSQTLANWADVAGNFPRGLTPLPNGQSLPLNVYWKQIITRCCRDDSIFTIAENDLAELISHCEEEIPHGSIYAYALMKMLRDCQDRQRSFFGNGDTSFIYGNPDTSSKTAEQANILAIIAKAPDSKPERKEYTSLVDYLSAKMAWDMKEQYTKEQATTSTESTVSTASILPLDSVVDIALEEAGLDTIELAELQKYEDSLSDDDTTISDYMPVDTYMQMKGQGE